MAWGQASCFTGLFPPQGLALFATEVGGRLDLDDFFFENLLLRHFGTVLHFSVVWDFFHPGKLPTFFFKKQPFYLKFKISGTSKLSKLWWDSWIKLATGKLSNFVMLSRTTLIKGPLVTFHSDPYIGPIIIPYIQSPHTVGTWNCNKTSQRNHSRRLKQHIPSQFFSGWFVKNMILHKKFGLQEVFVIFPLIKRITPFCQQMSVPKKGTARLQLQKLERSGPARAKIWRKSYSKKFYFTFQFLPCQMTSMSVFLLPNSSFLSCQTPQKWGIIETNFSMT